MNAKLTSLVAGIALLAGVGMANAEERLSAASMDNVTAAGGGGHHHHPHPTPTPQNPNNTAVASADASCKTTNCFTFTDTSANVTPHSADSSSFSYASNVAP
jgi:hypothetical protein